MTNARPLLIFIAVLNLTAIAEAQVYVGGDAPRRGSIEASGGGMFAPGFDNPQWHNGFEHDPEESARVRIELLRELAATGEVMVATHLPFPSVCHVATHGDVFRCVPTSWDY